MMLRFKFQLNLAAILSLAVFALPAYATTLHKRDGGNLIYDSVLDITWLQDAGMGGIKTWSEANTWAQSLVYGGYSDWRLPSMSNTSPATANDVHDCSTGTATACAQSGNELGYLYYYELTPANDPSGSPTEIYTDLTGNQKPFQNIPQAAWSGTQSGLDDAWFFLFTVGDQPHDTKLGHLGVWAVRSGDVVAAVPAPPTWPLLVLGLGAMGWGVWRRRPRLG